VGSNDDILIGTVGYHNLRNHSIGPVLLPRMQAMDWPAGVALMEMNWGPIAIVQQFQARARPFRRVVLLTAIERPPRRIGKISVFRWMGGLPSPDRIQACVGDAVTGVISAGNLLIIGEHFNIWPGEVFLIDVEPGPEQTGPALTPEVEAAVPDILQTVHAIALTGPATKDRLYPMKGNMLMA
jgi:hypothetical protein